jgi:hypothetical protein
MVGIELCITHWAALYCLCQSRRQRHDSCARDFWTNRLSSTTGILGKHKQSWWKGAGDEELRESLALQASLWQESWRVMLHVALTQGRKEGFTTCQGQNAIVHGCWG